MAPSAGVLKSLTPVELSACRTAATFLQSDFWGAFKACFGWEARAFTAEWESSGETAALPLLVLCRSLAAGFSLAYIPWGPPLPPLDGDAPRAAALNELAVSLKALLPAETAFIRFDPPWYTEGPAAAPPHIPPPFVRAGADIQAPDTVLLNLEQTIEDLMLQMKPKWRYNARLALKKGVTVRRAVPEEMEVFYTLLKETAARDGITIHHAAYYKTLLEAGIDTRLYLAEHEGDVLAGIVTLFRGREAVYLYGASSGKKRGLMAPYALQVKALEDAKAAGCAEYDLFGIPPDDDPAHPMAGLYLFKTGFGGRIIHRPGSWDFPCRPLVYRLFRCAEGLRKGLRDLKKKRPGT
ncbi:MAG: peptidoglycan bridge formation glycyltransferase FemA/FemB family protein [Treponema sp.]|nr:peptidoglycan bridge formation glycyltransferase FemA/FemB family protein [Treponema sp.]